MPGEGSGTARQSSCLENPMDGGAWWAAVHGVTKSRTRLSNFTSLFTFAHWGRKWQPTPAFLPGESQGRGSLVGCRPWGCTESDTTEATQQQQQHLSMSSLSVASVLSAEMHSREECRTSLAELAKVSASCWALCGCWEAGRVAQISLVPALAGRLGFWSRCPCCFPDHCVLSESWRLPDWEKRAGTLDPCSLGLL